MSSAADRAAGRPYHRAYVHLGDALVGGALPPGTRLVVSDIAAALALSPTPVREALARLVGEALVEDRRGEGYFVPRLAAHDIVELYGAIAALVQLALSSPRRAGSAGAVQTPTVGRWALGDLAVRLAATRGKTLIAGVLGRLDRRAAAVWRAENWLFPELAQRQAELEQLARADRPRALLSAIDAVVRQQQQRAIDVAAYLANIV